MRLFCDNLISFKLYNVGRVRWSKYWKLKIYRCCQKKKKRKKKWWFDFVVLQKTARNYSQVRAACAARLCFLVQPIKYLICGIVFGLMSSMLKLSITPNFTVSLVGSWNDVKKIVFTHYSQHLCQTPLPIWCKSLTWLSLILSGKSNINQMLYRFEQVPYLLCWKLGRTLKVQAETSESCKSFYTKRQT